MRQRRRTAQPIMVDTEITLKDILVTKGGAFIHIDRDSKNIFKLHMLETIQECFNLTCKLPLPSDTAPNVVNTTYLWCD